IGTLKFSDDYIENYSSVIVPAYQINTTRYVTETGEVLATYSLQTIAGQNVTSSNIRDFTGYDYKEMSQKAVQGAYPKGTIYHAATVNDGHGNNLYKAIREVVENNQV
ncbi:hypothetical protein, partial [Streptococcus suis]